jgi:hypothetical protein
LRAGTHGNKHLLASWIKYGEGAFTFSVIAQFDDTATMLDEERRQIVTRRTHQPLRGFNISVEPSNNQLGLKRSAETKALIGLAKRGNRNRLGAVVPEEMRRRISEKLKGRVPSEEERRKMSLAGKGRPKSEQWKAQRKGVKRSPETVAKMKAFWAKKRISQLQEQS